MTDVLIQLIGIAVSWICNKPSLLYNSSNTMTHGNVILIKKRMCLAFILFPVYICFQIIIKTPFMKKLFMASLALLTFAGAITIFQITSCKRAEGKDFGKYHKPNPCDIICPVSGTYAGTFTNYLNMTASFFYDLKEDNFTTGAGTVGDSPTAFGGYWHACDSIKIDTWNSINGNYYHFDGAFSNNRNTITGTYKNLTTTSETGTFILTKQ